MCSIIYAVRWTMSIIRAATMRKRFANCRYVTAGIAIGATVTCLLFSFLSVHLRNSKQPLTDTSALSQGEPSPVEQLKLADSVNRSHMQSQRQLSNNTYFLSQYLQLRRDMDNSLYYFDRPGRLIPLMQLTEAEKKREYRIAAAKAWLKSQGVVVAATVRNAMAGLPNSVRNLKRLRKMFGASWMVFVESDSRDSTRQFLYNLNRTDPNVTLLGCGTVNSPDPCRLNIHYSTGKQHVPGSYVKRNTQEEIERGLVMSALRNEYLEYVYNSLKGKASLLLIIDADISWVDWDLDNIAQGVYYFMAKPKLQQLCAHSTFGPKIYDPCTLSFFLNKHFGEDTKYPMLNYQKSIRNAPSDQPPVKVESCFQAFSFYRFSHLASQRLRYTRSPGEWMCEHNTLSRQLQEVYIDPQLRLNVKSPHVG